MQVRPGWGTPAPDKVDRRTHIEVRHGEQGAQDDMTKEQAERIIALLTETLEILRRSDKLVELYMAQRPAAD